MAHFVKNFDCKNEDHAMWLKKVGGAMAMSMNGDLVDMMGAVNINPLPGNPKIDNPMDFASVHFQLCMKYANAVLNGEAFVPKAK
ncbi:hypothetical protein MpV1_024c [Micromonas sp. RCC1109 virus MpV1]|uniref:hypothetical protein n=1 Tax=Micromonas sp. RCC1109 virus MpV1 TaxID=880161 RepID=UPI0001EF4434|nr:hypothetical protein MpV1_024c [Micromonas sp. RCC1109 virus MpV1]ADQ90947.1 hypothetical protein MpV1_024c [Micromonas sp. RCC1109 virus MpV1]